MKERMQADLVRTIVASEQMLAETPCGRSLLDLAPTIVWETLTLAYAQ